MALDDDLERRKTKADIAGAYGGLLTPIVVAVMGAWFTHSFDQAKAAEDATIRDRTRQEQAALTLHEAQHQCLDTSVQLITVAHGSVVDGDRAKRDSEVATLAPFVRRFCDTAGFDLSAPAKAALQQTSDKATEITVASSAQSALAPPPIQKAVGAAQASSQSLTSTATGAGSSGNIRIFFQISNPQQRPAADALIAALRGKTLAGRPLVTPGVENVSTYPRTPELRCLKVADCALAGPLASYLSERMSGVHIVVRDLSATYGTNPQIKPGTYELWFGPPSQQIAVSAAD